MAEKQSDDVPNHSNSIPPKRRKPPKLRRAPPKAEPKESAQDVIGKPHGGDEEDTRHESKGNTASTGPPSTVEGDRESDLETLELQEEEKRPPGQVRQTVIRSRKRSEPAEVWHGDYNEGRDVAQQILPTDVGDVLSRPGELARDTGTKVVGTLGDTAGQVLGGSEGKGKEEQLRLRLDLNLDIEVQLKAKIHGDLTLQLL